jgi:thymidylate kinase
MPYLIEVEGITCVGKTTAIPCIKETIEAAGVSVRCVKEPGTTIIGDKIRELLGLKDFDVFTPLTQMLLFLANRADIYRTIHYHDNPPDVIVSDRGYGSTMVYQVMMNKAENSKRLQGILNLAVAEILYKDLKIVNQEMTENPNYYTHSTPTIFLDALPEKALERSDRRYEPRDRLKTYDRNAFLTHATRARNCFYRYYNKIVNEDDVFLLIDANGKKHEVWKRIEKALSLKLAKLFK